MRDEETTEPFAESVEEWAVSPEEKDFPRVDVKSHLTFHHFEKMAGKDMFLGEILARDKSGEKVGHIQYARNNCDIHLSLVSVPLPEHSKKGVGAFLLREFINLQDKLCLNSTLQVVPFGMYGPEEIGFHEYTTQQEILKALYASFGFEEFPHGEDVMVRRPVCDIGKKLKPECENIDLSLLAELLEDVD
jgi:hypothetical protein